MTFSFTFSSSFSFTMKEGRCDLAVTVSELGEDLCVTATGGTAHVGAIALAVPEKERDRAEISLLTAEGHRDDIPARLLAEEIASRTGRRTAVVCGIHFDDITREEIECVMNLARAASKRVVSACGEGKARERGKEREKEGKEI
jgi:hypothetical protein